MKEFIQVLSFMIGVIVFWFPVQIAKGFVYALEVLWIEDEKEEKTSDEVLDV